MSRKIDALVAEHIMKLDNVRWKKMCTTPDLGYYDPYQTDTYDEDYY